MDSIGYVIALQKECEEGCSQILPVHFQIFYFCINFEGKTNKSLEIKKYLLKL